MRVRRYEILPMIDTWKDDMKVYYREVAEWRSEVAISKFMKSKSRSRMPHMPPCPSQVPSDEELVDMIVHARNAVAAGTSPQRAIKTLYVTNTQGHGSNSRTM